MADNLFDSSGLFNILKETGLLPNWSQHRPYGDSYGEYAFPMNQLVAPKPDSPDRRNTLTHEMTHAVDHNILKATAQTIAEKIFNGEKVSDKEMQFWDTYKKVSNSQIGRMKLYSRLEADRNNKSYQGMIPSSINQKDNFDSYRVSPDESLAFGVGNASSPGNVEGHTALPHLDPTRATEFSIVLDMYKQLPKTVKEAAVVDRKKSIDRNREIDKKQGKGGYQDLYDRFVNVFEDPFKPTVK